MEEEDDYDDGCPQTPERTVSLSDRMLSVNLMSGSSSNFGIDLNSPLPGQKDSLAGGVTGGGPQGRSSSNSYNNNSNSLSTPSADDLPASLSVAYLINWRGHTKSGNAAVKALALGGETDPTAGSGTDLSEDEISAALKFAGISVSNMDAPKDRKLAYLKANHDDGRFWQVHYSLHPNAGRVKNWMWVHARYREQAKALLDDLDASDLRKGQKNFQAFEKKLEGHSEFEDTQLFKFFLDEKLGHSELLMALMQQHANLRLSKAVSTAYERLVQKETTNVESCRTALQAYIDDLMDHLDLEEKTIVGPWLMLTEAQYKKYRTYLSWKYCVMY